MPAGPLATPHIMFSCYSWEVEQYCPHLQKKRKTVHSTLCSVFSAKDSDGHEVKGNMPRATGWNKEHCIPSPEYRAQFPALTSSAFVLGPVSSFLWAFVYVSLK